MKFIATTLFFALAAAAADPLYDKIQKETPDYTLMGYCDDGKPAFRDANALYDCKGCHFTIKGKTQTSVNAPDTCDFRNLGGVYKSNTPKDVQQEKKLNQQYSCNGDRYPFKTFDIVNKNGRATWLRAVYYEFIRNTGYKTFDWVNDGIDVASCPQDRQ